MNGELKIKKANCNFWNAKSIVMFFLLVSVVFTASSQTRKNNIPDLSQATIKIDSCGIYYKEQRLYLGTPLSDWEKVLVKPKESLAQKLSDH